MPLVVDPAFRSVKDKPDGICIWRIEVKINNVKKHECFCTPFESSLSAWSQGAVKHGRGNALIDA